MNAPAVLELPLDDSLLKVLSSESRREILRLLRERRMTGAELATRLDLGKPAVAEHLKKLQDAELIERFDDPERRWVYYNLSSRGRGILEPQRVRFYLVMSVAALALMVGVALGLGLVVLLQGQDGGATALDSTGSLDGGSLDPSLGQPGLDTGAAIDEPAATPSITPAGLLAASPASGENPPDAAVIDPEADPRLPEPIADAPLVTSGQSMQPFMVADSTTRVSLHSTARVAPETVLVYRAKDIDAGNKTMVLHILALDQVLADADLVQAMQDAADVPGVGLILQVPDSLVLPDTDGTATLSLPQLEAATLAPEASDATASQEALSAPLASTGAAPGVRDMAAPAPDLQYSAVRLVPSAQQPAPVPAPQPTLADSMAGDRGEASAVDAGSDSAAPVGPSSGLQSVGSSARASIPLVSLLAAALMVSIYLPNRRGPA